METALVYYGCAAPQRWSNKLLQRTVQGSKALFYYVKSVFSVTDRCR